MPTAAWSSSSAWGAGVVDSEPAAGARTHAYAQAGDVTLAVLLLVLMPGRGPGPPSRSKRTPERYTQMEITRRELWGGRCLESD